MPTSTPKPGIPVRGSQTGRPIMALLDLLGHRWTLRVIFELRDGPLRFRALQDSCDNISPTMLNTRLKQLREVGIAQKVDAGYCLTNLGQEFWVAFGPLRDWAQRWAASQK